MLRHIVKVIGMMLLLAMFVMASEVAPGAAPGPLAVPGGADEFAGGSYMGIDVQEVTPERVSALKLKEERGVEITMVDQDAPAGKAGLKEHDVILEFNGNRVEGVEQLRRMIHETPPSRKVTLGLIRNTQPMQVSVQLADRKQALSHKGKILVPPITIPPIVIPQVDVRLGAASRCGLVVDNLTPQLGEFFGVKNGEGVLVRSVEKGSAADAAGFRAGDVIVRVANEKIADKGDWRSALRNHPRGKISIGIVRDKREQTLSVNMPAPGDQSSVEINLPDLQTAVEEIEVALNRIGPELDSITQQAVEEAHKAIRVNRDQLEKSCKQMQKSIEKAKPQIDRDLKELEKQIEKAQHDLYVAIGDDEL